MMQAQAVEEMSKRLFASCILSNQPLESGMNGGLLVIWPPYTSSAGDDDAHPISFTTRLF